MSFHDENSPHERSRSNPRTLNLDQHTLTPETESISSTRRIGRPSVTLDAETRDGAGRGTPGPGEMASSGTVQGRTHARQPSPMLKKLARQMMYYPLVYMLIWTIPTAIRIYQSVTGTPAPFGIATVDKVSHTYLILHTPLLPPSPKFPFSSIIRPYTENSTLIPPKQACIVIQGFADAIIYGVNESSLGVWRDKFRARPPTAHVVPDKLHINVAHEIRMERVGKGKAVGSDGDSV